MQQRLSQRTREYREAFSLDAPKQGFLCQLCTRAWAQWPRPKYATLRVWKWKRHILWQSPMVCSTCRIMRQPEVTKLGDGRRRFWKRVFALYLGETYPSAGPRMSRAIYARVRIPYLLWEIAETLHQVWRPTSRWPMN